MSYIIFDSVEQKYKTMPYPEVSVGGSGITSVSHDSTLTGDGNTIPLSVVQNGVNVYFLTSNSYTATTSNDVILVNTNYSTTVSLPSVVVNGKQFVIKDASGNAGNPSSNITISGNGNQIQSDVLSSTYVLDESGESATIIGYNNKYYII